MLTKLPGWVVDNDTSVRREAAEWRDLTPAQRWHLAKLCASTAMWAVGLNEAPQRVLDYVDPLPESTVTALARLRRAAGWGDGAP